MSILIAKALKHYDSLGYDLLDVPYIVDEDVSEQTKPWFVEDLHHDSNKVYIGSGEQSFIQLMKDRKMPYGKSMCITPCYRNEWNLDKTHLRMFLKIELIHYTEELNKPLNLQVHGERLVKAMIDDAYSFFNLHADNLSIVKSGGHQKSVMHSVYGSCYEHDINNNKIEIGSYGIRETRFGRFVYGTGLALPRFNQTLGENIEF